MWLADTSPSAWANDWAYIAPGLVLILTMFLVWRLLRAAVASGIKKGLRDAHERKAPAAYGEGPSRSRRGAVEEIDAELKAREELGL